MKPITRNDAIRIFDKATDKDDPFWESLVENFADDEDAPLPSIEDVMAALGVSKSEFDAAVKGLKP